MIAVVGRLVPHKQVEHAIDAACALRERVPGLRLHVVGSGWWEGELHEYAERTAPATPWCSRATSTRQRKHEVYEQAWVLALPSLKEGWGLVVGEAGMHGTPTVAYRSAGGTRESIEDGRLGPAGRRPRRSSPHALGELLTRPVTAGSSWPRGPAR